VRALDYRSPEALFGAALRVAPDNPQAMWGLALALAERGQFDAASALYERMAAAPYPYVGPASWGTRGLMAAAQLYALHGEAARAQHTRERALAHDPQSALGQLQTAAQQLATGHEAQALLVLEKLQTQPFLLERVHRELAKLYARRGDVERARMQLMAAERARR
jgi:Tfp pilus assembly protein PilF